LIPAPNKKDLSSRRRMRMRVQDLEGPRSEETKNENALSAPIEPESCASVGREAACTRGSCSRHSFS